MGLPYHRHSGGDSGPPIDSREAIDDQSIAENKLIGIDPARVDEAHVGSSFVDPTVEWVPLGQKLAWLRILEAQVDRSYVGGCLVQV